MDIRKYGAADFPSSDWVQKIREWINNQMREDLFAPSSSSVPMSSDQSTIRLKLVMKKMGFTQDLQQMA